MHSWVLARGNRHLAMQYFAQALASDVEDIQRGTTAEGIHLAAMAGSIDLLQRCFTGLELRTDRRRMPRAHPTPDVGLHHRIQPVSSVGRHLHQLAQPGKPAA